MKLRFTKIMKIKKIKEGIILQDILVINGEVIWTGDDIFIAEGEDAIDQQAYLRATCDLGESIFYDGYGSRLFEYLGKPDTQTNKALIEAECREVLRKTEGISNVESVDFEWVEIEGEKKPSLRAKYCYENTDKKVETVFKFAV